MTFRFKQPVATAALFMLICVRASTAAAQQAPNPEPTLMTNQAATARAQGAKAPAGLPASVKPADPDYKLTPNDLIEVEVFGVSELKRTVRVNSTGHIALPLIGTLEVAGLNPADAEALIAIQYGAKYLKNPQVSVFVKEFTTKRITVDGAVAKPGIFPLTGPVTLLRALALAGGGGPMADLENVMLFRLSPEGKPDNKKYNLELIRKGEADDPMLQSDDVVVVNRDSSRVWLRDSLFRDVIDTLNPFSTTYRSAVGAN
jgi:polysaccharide export outer membrane protein